MMWLWLLMGWYPVQFLCFPSSTWYYDNPVGWGVFSHYLFCRWGSWTPERRCASSIITRLLLLRAEWEKIIIPWDPCPCPWSSTRHLRGQPLSHLLFPMKHLHTCGWPPPHCHITSFMLLAVYVCVLSHFGCVWLLVTPWTVDYQLLCSWPEFCSGLPFPSSGYLPNPGTEPTFLLSPALAGGFFTTSLGSPGCFWLVMSKFYTWW